MTTTKTKEIITSDNLIKINFDADAYFRKQGIEPEFTEHYISDNYIYSASLLVNYKKSEARFLLSKFDIQLGLVTAINEIDLVPIVPGSKDRVDFVFAYYTTYDFYLKNDHLVIDMFFLLPENTFNRNLLSIDKNTLQLISVNHGQGNIAECNCAVLQLTRLKNNKFRIIDRSKQASFNVYKSNRITAEQFGSRFIWVDRGSTQLAAGYSAKHYQYFYKKEPTSDNYCWEYNQISFVSRWFPLFVTPAQLNHAGIGKAEIIYCNDNLASIILFRQHESTGGELFYIEQTPELMNEIQKMSKFPANYNVTYYCDQEKNEFILCGQHILQHIGHHSGGSLLMYSLDDVTFTGEIFYILHEDADGTIYVYYVCEVSKGRSFYVDIPVFLKINGSNITCYKTDCCCHVCDCSDPLFDIYQYPIPYATCDKYSKNLVCVVYDGSSNYGFVAIPKEEVEKKIMKVQELEPVCFSWKYYGDVKMEKVQC
jgi:hypothetical protein